MKKVQYSVTVGIDFFMFQVADEASTCHDEHTIAHHHLGQFRCKHQDGATLEDESRDELIDFLFRAHVDAACRLIEQQDFGSAGEPLSEDHLLLRSATQ